MAAVSPQMTQSTVRTPRVRTRTTALLGASCLVGLSLGAPNACLGVHPPDVAPGTTGAGTYADPVIVQRDNLAFGGQLEFKDATVKGQPLTPFLDNGAWTSFGGHFTIDELREHGWHFVFQNSQILPTDFFHGPGIADVGGRAGVLVHGNTYALSLTGQDAGGDQFGLKNATYVKLADDVLVVPVVVGLWYQPSNPTPVVSVVDQVYGARNMFDFNQLSIDSQASPTPYWRTDGTKMTPLALGSANQLLAADIDTQVNSRSVDADELPPDEVWTQCGIQFQEVGYFVGTLDKNWVNKCSANVFGDPIAALSKELAGTPALRDYIIKDLQPLYVSYGDAQSCKGFAATPIGSNQVEIAVVRPLTQTAHELGRALGLDQETDPQTGLPVDGNLMGPGPSFVTWKNRKLTDAQCKAARIRALAYSQRFDDFNWKTGRTYSEKVPPAPGEAPIGGGSSDQVCCLGEADAYVTAPGTCAKELAVGECASVCCSIGTTATLYQCEQSGGHAVICNAPKR